MREQGQVVEVALPLPLPVPACPRPFARVRACVYEGLLACALRFSLLCSDVKKTLK